MKCYALILPCRYSVGVQPVRRLKYLQKKAVSEIAKFWICFLIDWCHFVDNVVRLYGV